MILAIIGHISAGKTSTARIIAQLLGARYVAADDVQRDLGFSNDLSLDRISQAHIEHVTSTTYAEIERRVDVDVERHTIVLDAVPTVDALHTLIRSRRGHAHVILLYCDAETWHARELQRTDRQPLDEHVLVRSLELGHALDPDYSIDTSTLHPADIALAIVTWLRSRHQPQPA